MNEIAIGLLTTLVVGSLIWTAVWRELAPVGGLAGRGRWWLGLALSMGLVAFIFKLTVLVSLLLVDADTLHALAAAWPGERPADEPAGPLSALDNTAGNDRWQALPLVALRADGGRDTPDQVALGRQLFEDRRLSADGQVACASCHDLQRHAGGDGRRTALGVGGQIGPRNTPTVWNAAFMTRQFWDGRAASLEEQALGPVLNPIEMGVPSRAALVDKLRALPDLQAAFGRAFPGQDGPSAEQMAQALAAFERTLITPQTRFDQYVRGRTDALTPQELRGMALFGTIGCTQCHAGASFSQAGWAGDGVPLRAFPAAAREVAQRWQLLDDLGAAPRGSAQGVWRVPSLRNVALTAPYFHNGRVQTLGEAVRVMAQTQLGLAVEVRASPAVGRDTADPTPHLRERRSLSAHDIDDLVAFLGTLSDPTLAQQAGAP